MQFHFVAIGLLMGRRGCPLLRLFLFSWEVLVEQPFSGTYSLRTLDPPVHLWICGGGGYSYFLGKFTKIIA